MQDNLPHLQWNQWCMQENLECLYGRLAHMEMHVYSEFLL